MPNYAQTVHEIRSFLTGSNQVLDKRVENLALDYVQACRTVSERLQRCQEMLNKGLRAEALHLAQTPPDLLDAISVLDFPELSQWDQLTALYGLPSIPVINRAAAAALNEAFALQEPIEALLRKQRRLALEQAPLEARLQVLHELAAADAMNPLWGESIGDFERRRLDEMHTAVAGAQRTQDLEALEALRSELKRRWVTCRPSPELLTMVEKTIESITKGQKRKELEKVTKQLLDAFGVKDVAAARALRERWEQLADALALPASDSNNVAVRPAFAWLAKERKKAESQQRFQEALAELQTALSRGAGERVLKDIWARVCGYNLPVPREVESQYQEAVGSHQRHVETKKRVAIAACCFVALMIAAATATLFYFRARETQYVQFVQDLTKLVDDGKITEAQAFYEKIEKDQPWMVQRPEFARVYASHKDIVEKERARSGSFQRALKELESADPEADVGNLTGQASRLVKLPEERQRLDNALFVRQSQVQERRRARDDEYTKEVEALFSMLGRLESKLDAADAGAKLQDAAGRVKQLAEKADKVSDSVNTRHLLVSKQVDSLQHKISQRQAADAAFAGLVGSFDGGFKLDDYTSRLRTFAKLSPESERAKDFVKAANASAGAGEVVEWNHILREVRANPWPRLPDEAKARRALLDQFLGSAKGHPELALARQYRDVLTGETEKGLRELINFFNDPVIANVTMVRADDQGTRRVFYVPDTLLDPDGLKAAVQNKTEATIRTIKSFAYNPDDPTTAKPVSLRPVSVKTAPQSVLARQVKAIPANALSANWEENVARIAEAVHDNEELDPLLKLVTLKKVVTAGAEGSAFLDRAFNKHLDFFARLAVKLDAPWMDPDDAGAQKARAVASKALRNLPSLSGVEKAATQERAAMERALLRSAATPVGVLVKGDDDRWKLGTKATLAGRHDLCVLLPDGNGATLKWVRVGAWQDGAEVDRVLSTPVPQGTLVFARPPMAAGE